MTAADLAYQAMARHEHKRRLRRVITGRARYWDSEHLCRECRREKIKRLCEETR